MSALTHVFNLAGLNRCYSGKLRLPDSFDSARKLNVAIRFSQYWLNEALDYTKLNIQLPKSSKRRAIANRAR